MISAGEAKIKADAYNNGRNQVNKYLDMIYKNIEMHAARGAYTLTFNIEVDNINNYIDVDTIGEKLIEVGYKVKISLNKGAAYYDVERMCLHTNHLYKLEIKWD